MVLFVFLLWRHLSQAFGEPPQGIQFPDSCPSCSGSLVNCRLLDTLLREHENLISFRALVFCWALSQLRAIYEGTEGVRVMGQTCWAVWGKRRPYLS